MIKISICTPTYNREYTLKRLYDSIVNQNFKNFEWLIIDDGSTDDTENLISQFKSENLIKIVYYKQENLGKHVAINKAIELADGELFFIVDSDDCITKTSLEIIEETWNSIGNKEQFIGIGGRKFLKNKKNKKFNFTEKYFDENAINFNLKYNNMQDKAEVFETKKLKNYKFKSFEGEKFMTEAVVWYKIADDGYKIRWFNEDIYVCEYLDDGLSKNFYKQRIKSLNSTCYAYNMLSSYKIPLKYQLRYKINYFRYGLVKFEKNFLINNLKDKKFSNLSYLIGVCLKIRDRKYN